jgi:hypothetical protein
MLRPGTRRCLGRLAGAHIAMAVQEFQLAA